MTDHRYNVIGLFRTFDLDGNNLLDRDEFSRLINKIDSGLTYHTS